MISNEELDRLYSKEEDNEDEEYLNKEKREEFYHKIRSLEKNNRNLKRILDEQNNKIQELNIPMNNSIFMAKSNFSKLIKYSSNRLSLWKYYLFGSLALIAIFIILFFIF